MGMWYDRASYHHRKGKGAQLPRLNALASSSQIGPPGFRNYANREADNALNCRIVIYISEFPHRIYTNARAGEIFNTHTALQK